MEPVRDRVIRVTFNADVHSSIQWNFKPQQSEIYVSDRLRSPLARNGRRREGENAGFGLVPVCPPAPRWRWAPVWESQSPRGVPFVRVPPPYCHCRT